MSRWSRGHLCDLSSQLVLAVSFVGDCPMYVYATYTVYDTGAIVGRRGVCITVYSTRAGSVQFMKHH
jgi:hypothetical protein